MGAAESKGAHRHRSNKHPRRNNEIAITPKCRHKTKESDILNVGNKNSLRRKNETIVPLITSSPLNPNLNGSILNHSFPIQRSFSEVQIPCYEQSHDESIDNLHQFDYGSFELSKGVHDYRKHMQRVDEANRPVLEGLCPDKMYVSTNDLRICDTQRLPPPLQCKTTQGFFRSIPQQQFYKKKNALNASFL
ncbi:unnamed protein product [Adineta steineri]|uniref:Uncharacterized protein n=1 Tax=Adineta steineri TaxID=433720 RepID=A0A813X1K0_9BILA|nr:unnamed protein product [Adineta steineri]